MYSRFQNWHIALAVKIQRKGTVKMKHYQNKNDWKTAFIVKLIDCKQGSGNESVSVNV